MLKSFNSAVAILDIKMHNYFLRATSNQGINFLGQIHCKHKKHLVKFQWEPKKDKQ